MEYKRDFRDLAKDYENYATMSCKPNIDKFPYPKNGAILDEDKTVRWNKEEILRLREAHDKETARLNTIKNKGLEEVRSQFIECIMEYVNSNSCVAKRKFINEEKANIIWSKAWEDGHSCGINEVVGYLYSYCDFAIDMLK